MGSEQSKQEQTGSPATTFSAGNFMQKDVQKWEEAQQNAAAIGACGCNAGTEEKEERPKPNVTFMNAEVRSWEKSQKGDQEEADE